MELAGVLCDFISFLFRVKPGLVLILDLAQHGHFDRSVIELLILVHREDSFGDGCSLTLMSLIFEKLLKAHLARDSRYLRTCRYV